MNNTVNTSNSTAYSLRRTIVTESVMAHSHSVTAMPERLHCSTSSLVNSKVKSFPNDLWRILFSYCDKKSLLNISRTCKTLNRLLNNRFWLRRCCQENICIPSPAWNALLKPLDNGENLHALLEPRLFTFDYRKILYKNPLKRNLGYPIEADVTLKQLEQRYLMQFEHGGNGICIEEVGDGQVERCFATSHGYCSRYFEIDLAEKGLDADFLDHIRPVITVRELCRSRRDCGAEYFLHAKLLKDNELFTEDGIASCSKIIIKGWAQWRGGEHWETAELSFDNYPAGVRRIGILTSGQDTQSWRGHYGSKFANTEVFITMPSVPTWRDVNDVTDERQIL